jgi:hypothetical protein
MTLAGFVARGAAIGALLGGAVGLLLGLITYPPTAWFASIEIGVPTAIAGAVIGLMVAGIGAIRRRNSRGKREAPHELDSHRRG